MPNPKNAMEIFQLLDKSNCRECGEKTCLAFAGAVFTGQKALDQCPRLGPEIVERFSGGVGNRNAAARDRDEFLAALQKEITRIDLRAAARRVGSRFSNGRLTLKVLGKDFSVDEKGDLFTDIHINPWVAVPFLSHILYGRGLPLSGRWSSFRELKGGKQRYPLFQKRCEEPLKRVADSYTDLFDDMVHLFGGKQVAKQFESDISVVLHPLPKVPIMVCYWQAEEGLASSLNIFFDETAGDNLGIDSVFTLGAGLAQMFTRLARRHGVSIE